MLAASRRPNPLSVGSDRSRFSSLGELANATVRAQPGVRPARRPPRCDLVGDDDEATAATYVDAAAATDVAVPCLGVPVKAGRYAFLGVDVGGEAWHEISIFCKDFVFFKFVKNL